MKLKVDYTELGEKIVDSMFEHEGYVGQHTIQSKALDLMDSIATPESLKKPVKIHSMDSNGLVLSVNDYGYTLARLCFYKPYYTLEVMQE